MRRKNIISLVDVFILLKVLKKEYFKNKMSNLSSSKVFWNRQNESSTRTCTEESTKIGWNSRLESVVKNIGEDSMAYKIMHLHESHNAIRLYTSLMLGGIVLGPMAGIISAIGASMNMSDYPGFVISEILLGFLSGIVVAILKFGKYEEVSNSNKSAAAKYASLESNVRRQLSLFRSNRISSTVYMDWLETKHEELLASAPLISRNVFEAYKIKAIEKGWSIPNSYSDTIDINEEFQELKTTEMMNNTTILPTKEEDNANELNLAIPPHNFVPQTETQLKSGTKMIKMNKSNIMSKIPEMNSFSDQMLAYEMKRMIGFNR